MFEVSQDYTKKDIYRILKVPINQQGGNWNTGYNRYNGDFFLFCNIGVPGRTGHDYNNVWDGNDLIWFGKGNTTVSQATIKDIISNNFNVYIFTRIDSDKPFTYRGLGHSKDVADSTPVQITWTFKRDEFNNPETLAEEIPFQDKKLWEGNVQKILVSKYERNPEARKQCIEHFGCACQVCEFDFEKVFGEMGKGFIHVHHLMPISKIKEGYIIDPLNDLIPVCPNCHSIIHKRNPCFTIEEVREITRRS